MKQTLVDGIRKKIEDMSHLELANELGSYVFLHPAFCKWLIEQAAYRDDIDAVNYSLQERVSILRDAFKHYDSRMESYNAWLDYELENTKDERIKSAADLIEMMHEKFAGDTNEKE